MIKIGYAAIAAFVSSIISLYLAAPPGLDNVITLIATIASIVGAIVGVRVASFSLRYLLIALFCSMVVFVLGVAGYRMILNGEPGQLAAIKLYLFAVLIFVPVGLIIELAGIKIYPGE